MRNPRSALAPRLAVCAASDQKPALEGALRNRQSLHHGFFEWARSCRVIWTDGRELPKDPDPRWMRYSVGNWEGDIFVINSLGFREDTWLDDDGGALPQRGSRYSGREDFEVGSEGGNPGAFFCPIRGTAVQ
jgi:hypothetical protein